MPLTKITGGEFDNTQGGLSVAGIITATSFSGSGASLTTLNASNISSGTLPDARFPATLPAVSGASLTTLNASNISSGTLPDARFPATLPAVSGASLTTLNASNISSGTLPDARFPATLPAVSGANLTGISGIPSGTVITVAASTAPTGYLKANGASLSTTTYAALFAAIGYTFGGSGASFTLPDLRGEFIRGWDDARTADNGRTFGSFQDWAIQNFTGNFQSSGGFSAGSLSGGTGVFTTSGAVNAYLNGTTGSYTFNTTLNINASSQIKTSSETRPRNIALLYCIKF